jgi:coenzyme F420 hydrogenase subunit beta
MDEWLFGRRRDVAAEPLGIFKEMYGGYAKIPEIRAAGASGGVGSAILVYALEQGIIDGALLAARDPDTPWRIKPVIARSRQEVLAGAGSWYALVPTNQLLSTAVVDKGVKRLGVVGCPCHIEALRKIQMAGQPSRIAKAITLTVGLLCETNFSWQATRHMMFEHCGLSDLNEVEKIMYRGGHVPKHFVLHLKNGSKREVDLFAYLMTYFFPFEVERCSMCFDWGGEAADIAIGDLWEPCTKPDEPGWNVVVARTDLGEEVIRGAMDADYLFARPSPSCYTIAALGCEGKKHGHAHSLNWRARHGWVTPNFGYEIKDYEPWKPEWRNANLKAGLAGHGGKQT